MRNALQFDLHNGGSPMPPAYALKVAVGTSQYTSYVDPTTGRPDTQIETVIATYELVEIATDKTVVNDMAVARVDYDIPGSQQRFAGQRALRNAEDRAIQVVADAIRNRLAGQAASAHSVSFGQHSPASAQNSCTRTLTDLFGPS